MAGASGAQASRRRTMNTEASRRNGRVPHSLHLPTRWTRAARPPVRIPLPRVTNEPAAAALRSHYALYDALRRSNAGLLPALGRSVSRPVRTGTGCGTSATILTRSSSPPTTELNSRQPSSTSRTNDNSTDRRRIFNLTRWTQPTAGRTHRHRTQTQQRTGDAELLRGKRNSDCERDKVAGSES